MFITTKKHDAKVKELMAEVARTGVLRTNAEELCRKYVIALSRVEAERDAAVAELTPLKAAKERQLQNLRDANARRSLAKAGLPASVVEGV